ncbi:MAG: type II secretion system protein [Christensenellales bacterium]|jgi:prepilin-type N-terminal cleavage/methylation domain-containing protein
MMILRQLRGKSAFTLIEILLAVSIIAAIALPLLSVFLQSIKTDQAAKNVLNANYIAQDYIENLDKTIYPLALSQLPELSEIDHYFLSAKIKPYGTANVLFSGPCSNAHAVLYEDGTMLAVFPDGKWHLFDTVPSEIALSVSEGVYTFSGGGTFITGPVEVINCALMINAMQKPSGITMTVTLGRNCKALHYCLENHADDISILGSSETYADIITGDTSLVHVTAYVFDSIASSQPISVSESYINIKNWYKIYD